MIDIQIADRVLIPLGQWYKSFGGFFDQKVKDHMAAVASYRASEVISQKTFYVYDEPDSNYFVHRMSSYMEAQRAHTICQRERLFYDIQYVITPGRRIKVCVLPAFTTDVVWLYIDRLDKDELEFDYRKLTPGENA